MAEQINIPFKSVPGLLPGDALQEQLKQTTAGLNTGKGILPPSSAADRMGDVITSYIDAPVVGALLKQKFGGPTAREKRAEFRGGLLKSAFDYPVLGGDLPSLRGALRSAGELSPEESRLEGQRQRDEAAQEVDKRKTEVQDFQKAIDKQRADAGLPPMVIDDPEMQRQSEEIQAEAVAKAEERSKEVAALPDPKQAKWLNAISTATTSTAKTFTGAARGLVDFGEIMATLTTEGADAQVGASQLREYIDGVDSFFDQMLPSDQGRSKDMLTDLAQGGGSMAGFLMGGAILKTLGVPRAVGTAFLGAMTQADQQVRDAENFDGSALNKLLAWTAGAGLGLTEAVPIDRMLFRMNEALPPGTLTRALHNTSATSFEEFIQEFSQSLGSDMAAKLLYDPTREIDPVQAFEQGIVGAIVGGTTAGGAETINALANVKAPTGAPLPEAPQIDETQQLQIVTEVIDQGDTAIDMIVRGVADTEVVSDSAIAEAAQMVADAQATEVPPEVARMQRAVDAVRTSAGEAAGVAVDGAANARAATVAPVSERLAPVSDEGLPLTPVEAVQKATADLPKVAPKTVITNKVVENLARPPAFPQKTVAGRGGTIPAPTTPNGTIELQHFSGEAREVLDPAQQGTGPVRGAERGRLKGGDAPARIYYGVQTDAMPALTEREYKRLSPEEVAAVAPLSQQGVTVQDIEEALAFRYREERKGGGYVREGGLGDIRHTVEVNPNDLYNIAEDPLGLRAKAAEQSGAKTLDARLNAYEKLIQENGFKGYINPKTDFGQVAVLFEAAKPTKVQSPQQVEVENVKLDPSELAPLEGNTQGKPVESVVRAARAYAASKGLPVRRQAEYVKVDPERAARIADAYDKMADNPEDPAVQAAYGAMIDETLAQFQYVKASGLEIEFIEPGQADPYPEGPKQVIEDLRNGHLWVFPTDQGFGTLTEAQKNNPLLQPTDENIGGRQLLANDVFRIVHDFFGHGIEGSGFGARGEENAWQSHMRLYSEAALPAVTSETRGQNSWVNYGPHGEHNRANQRDTIYADQKAGIMPEWTWREGVDDDLDAPEILAMTVPEKVEKLSAQVPGFAGVAPYLQDDEKKNLSKTSAAKIVNIFSALPSAEETAAVALAGKAKKGWYKNSANALLEIFGVEDAPRFAALLAALSPQTSVESNAINALTLWGNWVKAGRPVDKKSIIKLLGQSVQGGGGVASVLDAWKNNAVRALQALDPITVVLSGPKVSSFAANLRGATNEVTNDTWMANFALIEQTIFRGTGGGFDELGQTIGKSPGYKAMSALVRSAAEAATQISGEVWTPAEIQETVWSWTKALYEKAESLGESAAALLEAGGLTDADISATPDFATLFQEGVFRRLLEGAGYDINSLDIGGDADVGRAGSGRPDEAPEGAASVGLAYEQHLRNAAGRLDALRRQRSGGQVEADEDAGPATQRPLDVAPEDEAFINELFGQRGLTEADIARGDISEDDLTMLDRADVGLTGDAARAVTEFVGHGPMSREKGWATAFGVMHALPLEDIVSGKNPNGAEELEAAFEPVREALRRKHGDTIRLYRLQGEIDPNSRPVGFDPSGQRAALSWSSNPKFARSIADARPVKPLYTEEQIAAWEQTYAETGRVDLDNVTSIRKEPVTGSRWDTGELFTLESNMIYRGEEAITDTDSIRDFVESENEWRRETMASNDKKLAKVISADINLDDVVWATNRANQSEFIVKNDPSSSGYIDMNGRHIDDDMVAQTSQGRGAFKAEQQRPAQGVAGEANQDLSDVNLDKIGEGVVKLMGITARLGRFTLRGGNVMGQFSRRSGIVRLRAHSDLSTLIHEAGHALATDATGDLKTFIDGNERGLIKAATDLYGGDVSNMDYNVKVQEGFAEFFRVYTLNRGYARQHYPALSTAFEAALQTGAPELAKGLEVVGQQFAAYMQLPSAQLALNDIVSGKQPGALGAAMQELREAGFSTWFHEVVTRKIAEGVNRNIPLNSLVAEILNASERNVGAVLDVKRADDPRVLIRMAANSGSRAMVQMTDGVMDYRSLTPGSPSLRDALLRYHGLKPSDNLGKIDPLREQAFGAYLVALRSADEFRRMREGKIDRAPTKQTEGDVIASIQEFERKYGADFIEAAKMVHEYGMALWKRAYEAGLMSKEQYANGLDRQFYAPLQRDMSDRDVAMGDIGGINGTAVGLGQSIVKRMRGSDRRIVNPMDALIQKTFALERVIAENDVKKALAAMADKAGRVGALVERVPAHQLLGEQYSVQEVARQLTKDDTIGDVEAQDLMNILESAIEEGHRIALFRSKQAAVKGDNIVFFWEKGKLAALQIKDGQIGADVVNLLNGVGGEVLPLFSGLVSHSSALFRSFITSWPDFLIVNFVRDQVSSWLLTNVGYKPFWTGLKGVGDEIRQKDWARHYNAAMGIMGGMNVAALHQARVNRDINSLRKKGYLARAFQDNPIKGMARVVEVTETGSRLGVFKNAFARAKKDGLSDYEASIEASYLATDLMNYGQNGSRMMLARRTVPFLNAQLQGFYKFMRTLGGDEVRQRKGLRFVLASYFKSVNNLPLSRVEKQQIATGRAAWAKMVVLGLLGTALALAFRDDDDYQEASEYLRTTGWVIPTGDGRIFWVPKPFELAVVSNFMERAIEFGSGDTEAMNRFLRGLAMNLTPPSGPPAIQTLIELAANRDFFTGQEIVPDYMQGLLPELQYNNRTGELAKMIGEATGMSPLKIDHVLSGMGASAYRDISQAVNSAMGNRPATGPEDWFITRRFYRDVTRGSVSSQDFWKEASMTDGRLRTAEQSYKKMVEGGRDQAAEEYLDTLDEDTRAYAILNTHFDAEAKRLHPFYRVRSLVTVVSAMRRELATDLGVESTDSDEPIMLTAKEKRAVDQLLSEYIHRETRNSLVYMKTPGWSDKAPTDTQGTLDLLESTNPFIFEELQARIEKKKIYSAETVMDNWPDVKDRLIQDREEADLDDIVSLAKVM